MAGIMIIALPWSTRLKTSAALIDNFGLSVKYHRKECVSATKYINEVRFSVV